MAPNDSSYYFSRGLVKRAIWKTEEAIVDFNKAIDLDSNFSDYYYARGISKCGLKKYEEAIADLNEAITLDPNDAKNYSGRGMVKKYLKLYDEALKDYNQALLLDQNDINLNKDIIEIITQKIKYYPKDINLYFERANALYKLKNFKTALLDYNKAIELDPNNANIYYQRGLLQKDRWVYGQKYDAIKDFTKAIEIDSNKAEYYFQRGLCYEEITSHNEEAIEDFSQAIKLDSKKFQIYSHRGNAYYKNGNYEQAIVDFEKYLEQNPEDIEVQYDKKFAEILARK